MTAESAVAVAVTEITDQESAALIEGGWRDDDLDTPGWEREVKNESGGWVSQWVYPRAWPSSVRSKWFANSGGEGEWMSTFDEAMSWCDKRAGGGEPAEPGSATKPEDRFARWAGGGRTGERRP